MNFKFQEDHELKFESSIILVAQQSEGDICQI